jgi:hypothetical protein
MHRPGLLRCAVASSRRRGALSLFRLASVILHTTTALYEKHMIPRAGVKAGLLASRFLEKSAAALYPCLGRSRHRHRRQEAEQ